MKAIVAKIFDINKKPNFITVLWFLVPFIALIIEAQKENIFINNYLIYKNVFWHTFQEKNLFSLYPTEYFDKNHYGPLFAILIAPFAILPNYIGLMLWGMINVSILFYAVGKLPISFWGKNIILLLSLIETLTSTQNLQFNPMLCSWIILSYVAIKNSQLSLAAFLIVAGTFIKLYGVVGLPFIFFTKDYKKLIGYLILWSIILFCLPMFISSPEFIYQSYIDWFHVLVEKNSENINSYLNESMQDISVMGLFKRTTGFYHLANFYFIIPAGIMMLLPLFRFSKWGNTNFQLTYLAQLLIGLVIFSTSAESPTYVISVVGFGIWYVLYTPKPPPIAIYLLLTLLLILTIFSPTDLFPNILQRFVVKYALKALPCFLAWLYISYNLLFNSFDNNIATHAKA
ncbi:MAG: glycosyltransferase family 87 protein [Bacteroidetes bacterium]|nr:glycosyltransferase family 87 protein [Bacteroidota bacterium]